MYLHGNLCSIPVNWIPNMTILRKKNVFKLAVHLQMTMSANLSLNLISVDATGGYS